MKNLRLHGWPGCIQHSLLFFSSPVTTCCNLFLFKGCQTEENLLLEKTFSVFLSTTDGSDACSQVSHKAVCEVEVQCSPCVVSRHSGSDYRTSCFTGYDSVKSCASAVKDLCGVSMDVFALLLCLLTARAERSCDPPLCDKLLLFLMKLKLGISYSSLAVLFSVSRTTASRHFNSILRSLSTATQVDLPPPRKCHQSPATRKF